MSDETKPPREWWIYEGPSRFKDHNGIKTLGLDVYNDPINIVNCTQICVVARELYDAAIARAEAAEKYKFSREAEIETVRKEFDRAFDAMTKAEEKISVLTEAVRGVLGHYALFVHEDKAPLPKHIVKCELALEKVGK